VLFLHSKNPERVIFASLKTTELPITDVLTTTDMKNQPPKPLQVIEQMCLLNRTDRQTESRQK